MQSTLGHIQICIDPGNLPFYKELFTFLGWKVLMDDPEMLGVSDSQHTSLWFTPKMKPCVNDFDGNGANHFAMHVTHQSDVDAAVEYLKERGIPALFETPRHRPEFSAGGNSTYYQVMFTSPDDLLFEIVYMGEKDK